MSKKRQESQEADYMPPRAITKRKRNFPHLSTSAAVEGSMEEAKELARGLFPHLRTRVCTVPQPPPATHEQR